ncbi:acyltransferase family protein [Azohydromonas lata]|uniref:Acyltransferase n=1 Tax=Azohydromonas lata TaxID=45677 RepID=A0ABU5IJM0_9BURK|nr:acyltransferase [Azohydromonas lata]MDZ5459076.1 acyltransferase [Azohydromonas lata]
MFITMKTNTTAMESANDMAPSIPKLVTERANWLALDGLRGWAIIFVITIHLWAHCTREGSGIPITLQIGAETVNLTWLFATGHNAVIVFFVLSGFLLYRHWLERQGKIAFKAQCWSFAQSRARRILPGYLLYLVMYLLLVALVGKHRYGANMDSSNFLLNFFFLTPVANLSSHTPPLATTLDLMPGTWSLNAEMWFYAVMPLLALALGRISGRWSGWLLLLTATAGPMSRHMMGEQPAWILRYSVFGVFDAFIMGMAIAALAAGYKPRAAWKVLFPLGVAYYFSICAGHLLHFADYAFQLALASGLMILGLLSPTPSVWKSSLERPWIVNVGHWSYGLFLCNTTVAWYIVLPLSQAVKTVPGGQLLALNFAVGLPLMLLLARTTYEVLEQPLIRRVAPDWRQVRRRVGGLMLVYVAASLALSAIAYHRNPEAEFQHRLVKVLATPYAKTH